MSGSVKVGSVGTFGATPTPPGSVFPVGTTFAWTSSNVTIAAAAGTGLTGTLIGIAAGEITLTFAATLPNNDIVQATLQVQVTTA